MRAPISSCDSGNDCDDPFPARFTRREQNVKRLFAASRAPMSSAEARPAAVDVRVGEKTVELRTQPAFDDFWRFTAARHHVFIKRAAGAPPPWTQDVALATHSYCNVYRVLDRCSQYLIKNVIQKGPQDIDEVVFRVCLYNVFHRVETWELLCRAFPPMPTYAQFDEKTYIDVLTAAKSAGAKLYTGAFQKPAHRWTPVTHANHMWLIAAFMGAGLPQLLAECETLADVYAELKSFPGMGPFNSWQLALDLSYTPAFNFHQADLVVPGPGALAGLNLCFHLPKSARKAVDPRAYDGAMRYMAATQSEHFARLNLSFAGLGPNHLPLQPLDIEHTLCEFTKYTRQRGTRGAFGPRTGATAPSQVLPAAWAHRARRTERVCAVPRDLPKRYIVERVVARDAGRRLLLVRWLGYAPTDDTWEDEDTLAEDAPDAVAAFRNPRAKRKGPPGPNPQSHSAGSGSSSSPTVVAEMAPRKSASAAVTDADADGELATPPPPTEADAAPAEAPSTPKGKAPKAGKAVRSSPRKLPESGAVKTAYGKRKRAAGDDGSAPAPKRKRKTAKPKAASAEERYEIESIVDRRGDGRGVQYRVQWKGYPASQRTWEPASMLKQDAPAAVADFEKARVKKAVPKVKARATATKAKARTTTKARARTTTAATKRRRSGARK
ncbi:hypothetical protein AURDEDRAFT_112044 [Auricularia subglabra TFB-10046 SS5]|nr:hypothetical protein AURDEDRAFT_112044 [Auricularia subglabra TFB-10046 SS5]